MGVYVTRSEELIEIFLTLTPKNQEKVIHMVSNWGSFDKSTHDKKFDKIVDIKVEPKVEIL